MKVHESDEEHRSTITHLRDRLAVLEKEAALHQQTLDSTTQHNKHHIDKLHQDKAMLEVRGETIKARLPRRSCHALWHMHCFAFRLPISERENLRWYFFSLCR